MVGAGVGVGFVGLAIEDDVGAGDGGAHYEIVAAVACRATLDEAELAAGHAEGIAAAAGDLRDGVEAGAVLYRHPFALAGDGDEAEREVDAGHVPDPGILGAGYRDEAPGMILIGLGFEFGHATK